MSTAWAFFKRDLLMFLSYRTACVVQIVSVAVPVPVLYFVGKVASGSQLERLAPYGGDYFSFLLIGFGLLGYLSISLRTFNRSIRDSQLMGTLEIMILSPTPVVQLVLYSSTWVYAFTTFRFLLYLTLGAFFGIDFGNADLLAALVILVMAIPAFASFGILSAGLIVLVKRGAFINPIISFGSLALGGVLYPISELPPWLQKIGQLLPITHALEGMRLAMFQGSSLADLWPQLLILAVFALVLLPLSLAFFLLAVRRTKKTGTLSHY